MMNSLILKVQKITSLLTTWCSCPKVNIPLGRQYIHWHFTCKDNSPSRRKAPQSISPHILSLPGQYPPDNIQKISPHEIWPSVCRQYHMNPENIANIKQGTKDELTVSSLISEELTILKAQKIIQNKFFPPTHKPSHTQPNPLCPTHREKVKFCGRILLWGGDIVLGRQTGFFF